MPATRTILNLKHTSIHDHLLDSKNEIKSIMNETSEKSLSGAKRSPSTSAITLESAQEIMTNVDDRNLLGKLSNEYMNSILTRNNTQQTSLPSALPINQYSMAHATAEPFEKLKEDLEKPLATHYQQTSSVFLTFSGKKNEDPGKWLDHVFLYIEQQDLTPSEQRDIAAGRLNGEALLWYRTNRLKIPDMQSFIHQFLSTYNSSIINGMSERSQHTYILPEATTIGKESEQRYDETSKSFLEQNPYYQSSSRSASPLQVLQSARNEKVKLLPNFSGSENSSHWLKNVQQIGKSLKLNDQQIFELATIKLNGPAQEWFYHQDDEIDNWLSFKQAFLYAFPSPIQPTNIDYLAQLLSRKQGEMEPVGKFVQDINRLCLKLDNQISEQDKLQYLRRGLSPHLQHYALSITSLQDFLNTMQRHEQIEKERITLSSLGKSSPGSIQQQQNPFNRPQRNDYDYQQNRKVTRYEPPGYYYHQNSYPEATEQPHVNDYRICYQCNKHGHIQRDCPDNRSSQQHQPQHFQQRSH
jgi:hypothetical protein